MRNIYRDDRKRKESKKRGKTFIACGAKKKKRSGHIAAPPLFVF